MRIKAVEFQSAVNLYGSHLNTVTKINETNSRSVLMLYGPYGLQVTVNGIDYLIPAANVKSCIIADLGEDEAPKAKRAASGPKAA